MRGFTVLRLRHCEAPVSGEAGNQAHTQDTGDKQPDTGRILVNYTPDTGRILIKSEARY